MKGLMSYLMMALLLLFLSAAGTPPVARADTVSVACADVNALVQAIKAANDSGAPTTIDLAADCIYTIEQVYNDGLGGDSGAVKGDNGLPPILTGSNITINGHGSTIQRKTHTIPIDTASPENANGNGMSAGPPYDATADAPMFRIFQVNEGGQLTLNGLVLRNGLNWKTSTDEEGGAIASWGTVNVTDCTFVNNIAGCGGGISSVNGIVNVTRTAFYFNKGEK